METMNSSRDSGGSVIPGRMTLGDIKLATYLPIGLCLALVGWLYTPIFKWWWHVWMAKESYYSHGMLVPLISLLIVWLKRNRLKDIVIQPYVPGYLLTVPVLLVMVLASWAGPNSIPGLTFPLLLGGMVLMLLGRSMARELAFPIGYLYFMCVLPGFLLTMASFRIQMLSTMGGTALLRAVGFQAYREGAMIILPGVEVMVGAPCSGFRLLISLLAFTVLFVYLKEGPLWGRMFLLAFAAPLSLIVNSIRIALIAMVGELMGSEAMHSFHDYSGYIVLVLAFLILSQVARLVKCQRFNSMLMPSR